MQILIFANGQMAPSSILNSLVAQADVIIAADGGANHCADLQIIPHILIGDLDSIDVGLLKKYAHRNIDIRRFSPRKDATDLELALDEARLNAAEYIWIIGGLGHRWDMSFANLMLAAAEKYESSKISLLGQDSAMHILHPGRTFYLNSDGSQVVSLIPLRGDVTGVTLEGFEYPLTNHIIPFGSSIGISNVTTAQRSSISHAQGVLLCVSDI